MYPFSALGINMKVKKKQTDIVKYNNALNKYAIYNFRGVEQNIFFCLLSLFFDVTNTARIVSDNELMRQINIDDMMRKVHYTRTSTAVFQTKVKSVLDKILSPILQIEDGSQITGLVCFRKYHCDLAANTLQVWIDHDFYDLIKGGYFTRFELAEFVALGNSQYAKSLYRILKQYRLQGWHIITVDELKRQLNIPDWYRQREIDERVFKVSIPQLKRELDLIDDATGNKRIAFRDLKVEKQRKDGSRGRGGTIISYKFTWNNSADLKEIAEYKQEKQAKAEQQQLIQTKPKPKRKKLQDEQGRPLAEGYRRDEDGNLVPDLLRS